jgi:hypothetical protein
VKYLVGVLSFVKQEGSAACREYFEGIVSGWDWAYERISQQKAGM